MLSIVIPTYNEGDNIVAIVEEIEKAISGWFLKTCARIVSLPEPEGPDTMKR